MFKEKFFRILWTVNGILVFLSLLAFGFVLIKEFLFDDNSPEPSVIVGEELEEAKKSGLALQGLEFYPPFKIYGLKGYVLPVALKTYDVPKKLGDNDRNVIRSPRINGRDNFVNVIFLDNQHNVTTILLDKKGFIETFKYPEVDQFANSPDTSIHVLSYLIGFEDTNHDGNLNHNDNTDLYLSDLDGKNFIKVTNGIDVTDFEFLNRNEMLIQFLKREDSPGEHKGKYFTKYFINEKRLEDLDGLHKALDKIEKDLTQ